MTKVIENYIKLKFPSPEGKAVNPGNFGDPKIFARDLGLFLYGLQRLDIAGASAPSFENSFAGSDLTFFEAEIEDLLNAFKKIVPKDFMQVTFEKATKKPLKKAVWLHGCLTPENVLVKDGRLSAVFSIEKAVVGDPACDLGIAWSLFDKHVRKIFFAAAEADAGMVERARMHALRQALKTYNSADIDAQIMARDALSEIMEELNYQGQDELFDNHIDEFSAELLQDHNSRED